MPLNLLEPSPPGIVSLPVRETVLYLVELFPSIQGESSTSGLPTFFIRLSGCNLRCRWCDTPYSFGRGAATSIDAIIEQLHQSGLWHVCVTGGEPLLQQSVYPLMKELCDKGFCVSLETGGSLSTEAVDARVRVILDLKCPGSKMSHHNLWDNVDRLRKSDEVKFVIANRDDYDWALSAIETHQLFERAGEVLFSPVHGELCPKELVSWMVQDRLSRARLNLQLHKYVWSPETRGV